MCGVSIGNGSSSSSSISSIGVSPPSLSSSNP